MKKLILQKEMFESGHFNLLWEDTLDILGVDQVSINPDGPDYTEYPDRVELTVTEVRVV